MPDVLNPVSAVGLDLVGDKTFVFDPYSSLVGDKNFVADQYATFELTKITSFAIPDIRAMSSGAMTVQGYVISAIQGMSASVMISRDYRIVVFFVIGSLSDVYEQNLLDALLGQGFTKDTVVHVALCTSAPGEGVLGVEPAGNAYARVAIDNDEVHWPDAASVAGVGKKVNGLLVTFPAASGPWGVLTHFMLMNHATSTDPAAMICYGTLGSSRPVGVGDVAVFNPGDLAVTAD